MNIDALITGNAPKKRRANATKSAATKSALSSTTGSRKRPRQSDSVGNNNTNGVGGGSHHDEDDLLALALGSSSASGMIRDADQYEESVLRDAEMANTPRLMITRANDSVAFGFPSLQGLVPSRSVHADLGHVRKVLRQLRKGNHVANGNRSSSSSSLLTNTKDCLKEQMLLALMQSASGDPEMGVFPQQEAKQEWKRRKLYRDGKDEDADSTNTTAITKTGNHPTKPNATRQQQQRQQASEKQAGGTANGSGVTDDATPEGRLEGIKKGVPPKKKLVRFSEGVKGPVPSKSRSLLSKKVVKLKPKAGRRRISIQERRRREEGEDTKGDDDNDGDEHEISRTVIVEHLKQVRMEREKRRKHRKKAWRDTDGENDHDFDDDDDDSENEFEFTGEEEEEKESQPPSASTEIVKTEEDSISSTPIPDLPTSAEEGATERGASESTVICPLCGQAVPIPEIAITIKAEDGVENEEQQQQQHLKSHRDAILAQHMSICQTQRRSRRRNSASTANGLPIHQSRRERTRGASRPNYAEAESDEDMENASTRQNSIQAGGMNGRIKDENDYDEEDNDDDQYRANGDIQGEEEEEFLDNDMDEDDKEIITGNPAASKMRPRRSSRAKASRKPRRASKTHLSSRSRPPPLDDWYEEDYEDRVDEWIDHGLEKMPMMQERDADEIAPGEEELEGGLIVPGWTNDRLFPYQRTGLRWLWELHRQQCGGILGDEMGLGKTIQVASFLGSMAASRKLKSILIISPATMLQHWLKEMAKWAPGVRRILIHQSGDGYTAQASLLHNTMGQRKITTQHLNDAAKWLKTSRRNRLFEIIDEEDLDTRDPSSFCGTAYAFVTTFENVRRNEEIWTRHPWSYVVIDEAQKIRNPTADITLVCKRLKTPHRLALSGTPIQNDLRELWSIFDFVFPGRLGILQTFETEFATPIKRGGYSNASPMQVQLAYRCAVILKDLINPYLLRRLKKDIKEVQRMPGKKEQVLFCRLSDQQRSMYEAFLRSDHVKKVFGGSAQLLGAITVMRKICNHPDLVSNPDNASMEPFLMNDLWYHSELKTQQKEKGKDSDDSACEKDEDATDEDQSMIQRSGKLEILAKILPLWKKQGHRVLIFCQWKKMLDIIMTFVVSKGWKFSRLDGNTNVASRQRLVDTFNSDESYFGMLCTTRTGGVGLNLVGADRIILYDPDWNPQTDAQARERAWRFGQKREVTVFRMICAGTVEEKIYQRQIFKTAISNSVLQNSKQRRLFTKKDLKDLFSLKADNGSIVSGGEGVTETSELTKGTGFIDPDDESVTKSNQDDEGETMRTVLKSKGLAGIFDHDIVEGKTQKKKASVREMEARAKQIAREALQNLQQSVREEEYPFERESRFGGPTSQSNNLLSSIANRKAAISNATSMSSLEERKQHTQLLKTIHNFVRSSTPTTDEILNEFSSNDPAVFRKLLKSIATLNNGRWTLK